mgnify:FL=1
MMDKDIIGGLIQNISQTEEQRVPILGRLPLLGQLFRHTKETESQTEFIIYITPHLITDATRDYLKAPGLNAPEKP